MRIPSTPSLLMASLALSSTTLAAPLGSDVENVVVRSPRPRTASGNDMLMKMGLPASGSGSRRSYCPRGLVGQESPDLGAFIDVIPVVGPVVDDTVSGLGLGPLLQTNPLSAVDTLESLLVRDASGVTVPQNGATSVIGSPPIAKAALNSTVPNPVIIPSVVNDPLLVPSSTSGVATSADSVSNTTPSLPSPSKANLPVSPAMPITGQSVTPSLPVNPPNTPAAIVPTAEAFDVAPLPVPANVSALLPVNGTIPATPNITAGLSTTPSLPINLPNAPLAPIAAAALADLSIPTPTNTSLSVPSAMTSVLNGSVPTAPNVTAALPPTPSLLANPPSSTALPLLMEALTAVPIAVLANSSFPSSVIGSLPAVPNITANLPVTPSLPANPPNTQILPIVTEMLAVSPTPTKTTLSVPTTVSGILPHIVNNTVPVLTSTMSIPIGAPLVTDSSLSLPPGMAAPIEPITGDIPSLLQDTSTSSNSAVPTTSLASRFRRVRRL